MADDKTSQLPHLDGMDLDDVIYHARISEQTERYDDMVHCMRKVATEKKHLSIEERNLLSVAYKNVVGARRASWRILSAVQMKEENKQSGRNAELAGVYKRKVEKELEETCKQVVSVLDTSLIPTAQQGDKDSSPASAAAAATSGIEASVFYLKMKGDYYRYIAEFAVGLDHADLKSSSVTAAVNAYTEAKKLAEEGIDGAAGKGNSMPPTHPIRLGLALNFSVFYYEIMMERDRACALAKEAFDDAIAELDTLQEESYKDATLIMQLLRDNLTLWTANQAEEAAEQQ